MITRPKVKSVRFVNFTSGEKAPVNTLRWDVNGTDLGIPVYSAKENALWLFYGDTFATPLPSDVNWRGTVIGKTHNFDFSHGVMYSGFVPDDDGNALGLIVHHKSDNEEYYERTKICQGAVETDGVMYAFYESIRHWGEPGYWDVNYSGAIKSRDGGKTWQRVYDLTWTADNDKYRDVVKRLAEEDVDMQPSGVTVDVDKHFCPAFGQMYPIYGKDGYVYVYGRRGGRQYGATIARVAEQNIERFDEYEYYVNDNGVRSWVKGADGLAVINAHERESYVVDLPVSNFSVAYNNYLGGWIAMYYKPARGIVMRVAPTPYGPFGDETDVLLPSEKLPCGKIGLYGGFTHELMSANAGKTIYFIASQWNTEAYCSELFELCFE